MGNNYKQASVVNSCSGIASVRFLSLLYHCSMHGMPTKDFVTQNKVFIVQSDAVIKTHSYFFYKNVEVLSRT